MSKIIGITVGTPLSPHSIKEKLQPVTSVNGVNPDEHGNVEIEVSSEEMLELLAEMGIVQPLSDTNNVVYTDSNDKLYVL